jgi:SSS family solute:Na+ symporter
MSPLDWIVVLLPLAIVVGVGIYANRYVRSVADFLSANRSAGRYLLCIAGSELGTGAVVFVSSFEVFSHGGFAYGWWGAIGIPLGIILSVTGFVSYRYRQTRAMTLAQFFEIRYNKSFRLFTGLLGFFAGMLNFGIIPGIGARAMVYFLGLPETVRILSLTVPTYVPLMALFLSLTLFVALSGGVVTVMMINTIEGIMSQLFYLIIILTLLSMFSWSQMHHVLLDRPPKQSMVNPFDTSGVRDFNLWNVLMGMVTGIIATGISWQNSGAYKTAALTPHEGRMSSILGGWLGMGKGAVVTLLALAAVTYLHHPDFAAGAAHVHALVHQISNVQAQEQMEAPIALACLLPVGVKGLFCAVLLMGIFGGDATHLHSWGSIFIQDVLVPLRKTPFGPRAHLFVLRCSIIGVACFAFLFGTFFHLTDYISMWFGLTQAIFTGGAGSAILGGLYWKKGTAAGAWGGFITGSTLSIAGIIIQQVYRAYGGTFYLNGTQIGFIASLCAVSAYAILSLLTFKEDFNLDRMLHRGVYAAMTPLVGDVKIQHHRVSRLAKHLGLDDNFTRTDKWLTAAMAGWGLFWFSVFVVGSIWNLVRPWPNEAWASYYHVVGIGVPVFFAFITGIWFAWGGLRDMKRLFGRLSSEHLNALDDGTVVNNQNLDELVVEEKIQEDHEKPGARRVHEDKTKVS